MTRPLSAFFTLVVAAALLGCGVESAEEAAAAQEKTSALEASFERASREYQVPVAVLKSIAYVETRVRHRPEASLTGGYGVMQLVEREDWNMLGRAAELIGQDKERLKIDPDANIRGAAAVLRELADKSFASYQELNPNDPADFFHAVSLYPGLTSASMGQEYAADVYRTAEMGFRTDAHDGMVTQPAYVTGYREHLPPVASRQDAVKEYPGAYQWLASPNYSNGRTNYTYVLIHTTQGSYAGTLSWFRNTSSNVSSHYVVRSSDGQITQMVEHADTAWHAQCYNSKSVGIEHEGYVQDPAKWYTEAMYTASAKLTRWIADRHGIPRDRTHIIGHKEVAPSCNTGGHYDPGTGWNWTKYMALVNGTTTTPTTGKLMGAIYQGGDGNNRVAGATVTAGGKTVTTGTDGLYEFVLNPGTYTVNVSKSGYSSNSVSRAVTAGGTVWGSMEINAQTATGSVKGKIFVYNAAAPSDMSQAITGAVVTCNGQTVTTGSDGMYSFTLNPGTYTVSVTKTGFQNNQVSRAVTSGATVWGSMGLTSNTTNDTLPPQVAISFPQNNATTDLAVVTVTGTASDNVGAVANVKVKLNSGAEETVAVTSAMWSHQLKLAPGANTLTVRGTDAAGNTDTATATITFNAGISGFVYQSGDESARVPDASVKLLDPATGAEVASATTGNDGAFSLSVSKVDTDYRLVVSRTGFLASAETISIPSDARISVKLPLVVGEELEPTDVAIELTSPKDNSTVDVETLVLYGVVHGLPVASVTVNGVGADLFDGGGWTSQVNLKFGRNEIEVVANGLSDEVITQKFVINRVEPGALPETSEEDQQAVKQACAVAPGAAWMLILALVPMLRRRKS